MRRVSIFLPAAIALSGLLTSGQAWCAPDKIIATFGTSGFPQGNPLIDQSGNLFGATSEGSDGTPGKIFEIVPPHRLSYLFNFPATAASDPVSRLVSDGAGNLYGTTAQTAFELKTDGTLVSTSLYAFIHGIHPGSAVGGLVLEPNGDLEGVAYIIHKFEHYATIFTIAPGQAAVALYWFYGSLEGASPVGDLVADAAGNVYGATENGGAKGGGAIYRVTPAGVATVLYSFGGKPPGGCAAPEGGVVLDSSGNIFGTTYGGGSGNYGCVFELTPSGDFTILHQFTIGPNAPIGPDGGNPAGDLAIDANGALYGVTEEGGSSGTGVVFELRPNGHESIIHSFTGGSDVAYANGGLSIDALGNLSGGGLTYSAGVYGGVMFKIKR